MIRIVKADGKQERELLSQIQRRSDETDKQVTAVVTEILEDVKANGDAAVLKYTEKFDCVPEKMKLTRTDMKRALDACNAAFLKALEQAAENIKAFHARQKQQSFVDLREDGTMLGMRVRGLARVGVYVPGGTAAYPSSVIMNAIPAKIAGVGEIIMTTPPVRGGYDPNIIAAAYIAGVDTVFLCGGAQAVAALAYGTETIPKVDKIVGPGNIYVATAKKLCYGRVDIDMVAGPSEILILADGTANPKYLAADLMSQAEHDLLASAVLLTTSETLAEQTKMELERQVKNLSRSDIIKKSLRDFGAAIVCRSMEQAIDYANELAPEHLEVAAENPMEFVGKLHNAGSVFLGEYSPEPLGDYFAGPNHVLPTAGTARFFSPLSVDSFLKKSSFIYYTKKALERTKDAIVTLAEAEKLTAHANAVKVRFD